MDPANFKLLVHHHNVAFAPSSNEIWINAGIARWILALSQHFLEIGLLLPQRNEQSPQQDTLVTQSNIKLYSLGSPGHYWDRISRISRISHVCHKAGSHADGLLIRGITPSQYTVLKSTPVHNKAFLLVRSPRQKRIVKPHFKDILSVVINHYRERQFDQIARNNTLIMTNSPLHVLEIERLLGVTANFVPTNTIRQEEFTPFHIRPLNSPVKLLFCGRINFLKGLRELITALATIRNQGLTCELDIVGSLDEPTYSQLCELAGQLDVTNSIHWHGYIPFGSKLLQFYRSADVFVLPTYTEGFPRVLWEAAGNCCPVISTPVGGIPALFKNEEHALLVPPKDALAVAKAVSRLLSDDLLRGRLVENAYNHALNFTVEASAKKLADILSTKWN